MFCVLPLIKYRLMCNLTHLFCQYISYSLRRRTLYSTVVLLFVIIYCFHTYIQYGSTTTYHFATCSIGFFSEQGNSHLRLANGNTTVLDRLVTADTHELFPDNNECWHSPRKLTVTMSLICLTSGNVLTAMEWRLVHGWRFPALSFATSEMPHVLCAVAGPRGQVGDLLWPACSTASNKS